MRHNPSAIKWMKEATAQYHQYVELAHTYLAGRDLWDEAILDTFRLGVVVNPRPEHRHFEGRLSIPYLTPSGTVGLNFRCILEHECRDEGKDHKKYLKPTASEDRLYNVQALHQAEDILYIAEGELDTITAHVVGFPTVGIGGASKYEDHYTKLFEDFQEVIVLADGDSAGEQFASRILHENENARVVYMPDGEDVNSIIVKHGDERLRRIIASATISEWEG